MPLFCFMSGKNFEMIISRFFFFALQNYLEILI